MGRESQFSKQDRTSDRSPGVSESDEESTDEEHADILASGLDDSGEDHKHASEEEGPSAAISIIKEGCEGKTSQVTEILNSVQQTQ